MTRTVARLILAMLLLPCTGAVFILLMLVIVAPAVPPEPEVWRLLLMWSLLYVFVGAYWVLLWWDMVPWNRQRVGFTLGATAVSLAGGIGVAGVCLAIHPALKLPLAVMIGGGTVPITWVLGTVLIWRETATERLARLTAHGMPVIACPLCGYNLAGLTEVRCPECGAKFTLEQVLLGRPQAVRDIA